MWFFRMCTKNWLNMPLLRDNKRDPRKQAQAVPEEIQIRQKEKLLSESGQALEWLPRESPPVGVAVPGSVQEASG